MEKVKEYLTTDNLLLALAGIGAYKLAVSPALSFLGGIYRHFLRPRLNFKKRYGEKTWAMITGATSGIGLGFAEELAKEGFNLILVGRSTEKLLNCKVDLEKKFPEIQIETRKIDLMSTNVQDYIDLGDSVEDLDVSLLVNNAGYANLCPLQDEEYTELERMIKTNIGPYVYLTRSILPRMLKRDKKSGIIFTSSIGSKILMPCLSTYAATKAFNDHFSQSLAYELVDQMDVLSFIPARVSTNMNRGAPSFNTLTPIEAAQGALDALGREIVTEGHWRHVVTNKKSALGMAMMPQSWLLGAMNKRMRAFAKKIKERNQKKEE